MVAGLLRIADLDWAVPDYTTLCRRQTTLAVQIPYRRAEGPLGLLVDSTVIKFLGDDPLPGDCDAIAREGAESASGHGYGRFGHPGGGVRPQQRR